ncbi:MAG: hypothetical protein H7Y33_09790 [Cytophagales bacterium]|nr:hypothetical protein [Rhizobacter sp.]
MATLLALHWPAMPWPARILAVILAPGLLAWSAWPQPWRHVTRFIANEDGMYFPAYPPLTISASSTLHEEWLEVPWENIVDIRLAREVGEDGKCVAFDVLVTASERSRFFAAVGTPRDRREPAPAQVSAAYGGWPRSPARVVEQLESLRLRSV